VVDRLIVDYGFIKAPLSTLRSDIEELAQADNKEMQLQKEKINSLMAERTHLKGIVVSELEANAKLQQEMGQKDAQIRRLQNEVESKFDVINDREQQIMELEIELNEISSFSEEKIAELQDATAKQARVVLETRAEVAQLAQEVEYQAAAMKEKDEQIEEVAGECRDYFDQLEQFDIDLLEANERVGILQDDFARHKALLNHSATRNLALEQALGHSNHRLMEEQLKNNRQLMSNNETIMELRDRLDATGFTIVTLTSKHAEDMESIHSLRNLLSSANTDRHRNHTECLALVRENNILRGEIRESREENKDSRRQLADMQEKAQRYADEYDDLISQTEVWESAARSVSSTPETRASATPAPAHPRKKIEWSPVGRSYFATENSTADLSHVEMEAKPWESISEATDNQALDDIDWDSLPVPHDITRESKRSLSPDSETSEQGAKRRLLDSPPEKSASGECNRLSFSSRAYQYDKWNGFFLPYGESDFADHSNLSSPSNGYRTAHSNSSSPRQSEYDDDEPCDSECDHESDCPAQQMTGTLLAPIMMQPEPERKPSGNGYPSASPTAFPLCAEDSSSWARPADKSIIVSSYQYIWEPVPARYTSEPMINRSTAPSLSTSRGSNPTPWCSPPLVSQSQSYSSPTPPQFHAAFEEGEIAQTVNEYRTARSLAHAEEALREYQDNRMWGIDQAMRARYESKKEDEDEDGDFRNDEISEEDRPGM